MKKLNQYSNEDIEKLKATAFKHSFSYDEYDTNKEGLEILAKDEDFFKAFVTCIKACQLHETDRRCKAKIFAEIPRCDGGSSFKRITVSEYCPANIDKLVKSLKEEILADYAHRLKMKEERKQLKKENKIRMSAMAFTHKYLENTLGIKPGFSYSDTRKTQYMLYKMPFTNSKEGILYTDEAKKFAKKFQEALKYLNTKFGIYNDSNTPFGGSRIRGCWTIYTYGPDIIYNKATGEAEVAK